MTDYTQFRLGEDSSTLRLDGLSSLQAAVAALVSQARRSIDIFTLSLDKPVFDQPAFVDAVRRLATAGRHTQIRILIRDSTPVAKEGHRLYHLGQKLTSKIHFHRPDEQHLSRSDAFLLVDTCGLLYQPRAERRSARLSFNTPYEVRDLKRFFDEAWHFSGQDPYLRRLNI